MSNISRQMQSNHTRQNGSIKANKIIRIFCSKINNEIQHETSGGGQEWLMEGIEGLHEPPEPHMALWPIVALLMHVGHL